MRNGLLKGVLALAAVCVPTLAMAQTQRQTGPMIDRERSWELSLGTGMMLLDGALGDFLGSGAPETRFANTDDPKAFTPTVVGRIGYNLNRHLGFSVSGGAAFSDGVRYWTPTLAMTYTANLNARFSPFVLVGTQLTRIEGRNDRVTHSVWGAHAGLGIRKNIGHNENVALRLEGRLQVEHYHEVPMSRSTVYNPVATVGLSWFLRHRPRAATAGAACPACPTVARQRPDTVRVYVPFFPRRPAPLPAVVVRDTVVLEGINFDFDSSAITPEAGEILDHVARQLLDPTWRNVRFEVAGHTSSIGGPEYNMALSQRRAESVRAYLFSRGVADNRMVARGYGLTQPLVPNDAEGYAWQNRRVELRRIW